MLRRTRIYHGITFLICGSTLLYIALVWCCVLVEQITVNQCITGADCFILEQTNFKPTLNVPPRVNDCSKYSLPDGMVLWCYKAGFYFSDACAKAGGMLAIASITFKLYFQTLITCSKGQKKYFYLTGTIAGCIAVLLTVGCILLSLLLPSNSYVYSVISGTNALQVMFLLFVALLMPIATCLSAQVHSSSQTEYEELPEN